MGFWVPPPRPDVHPMGETEIDLRLYVSAYQIAHAALGGRGAISEAVLTALTQADVFMHRQGERRLSRNPTRGHLTEAEAFQYLLWVELERREIALEEEDIREGRPVDEQTQLLRYVKCLICNCFAFAPFKVVIGVSRLLYGYGWGDAQEIYYLVIQDVDTGKNQNVSNAWVRDLTLLLRARFRNCLPEYTDGRGKLNFRFQPISERLRLLTYQILRLLTPWNSSHILPDKPTKGSREIKFLRGRRYTSRRKDQQVGRNRRHAVIDPECFSGLATVLGLAPASDHLQLPYFSTSQSDEGDGQPPVDLGGLPEPPPTYYPELINGLREHRARRKSYQGEVLHIKVDGRDTGTFNPKRGHSHIFRVGAAANLVEVSAREGSKETPLAVISLRYNVAFGQGDERWNASIKLGGGQKIILRASREGADWEVEILIRYEDAALFKKLTRRVWPVPRGWDVGLVLNWADLHKRALLALTLCLLIFSVLGAIFYMSLPREKSQEARQEGNPPAVNLPPSVPTPLPADEVGGGPLRGSNKSTETPTPTMPGANSTVSPELSRGVRKLDSDLPDVIEALRGYPASVRQDVMVALKTRQIAAPKELEGIRNENDRTMSGSGAVIPIRYEALSLDGVIIRTDRPTFRWKPVEGVNHYTVRVYDDEVSHDEAIAESPLVSSSEWRPLRPLPRGRLYSWQIKLPEEYSVKSGGDAPTPEWRFRVLSEESLRKVEAAERVKPSSHLAMGVVYARAGLLEEAEREFQILVESEPQNQTAQKLLQSVQGLRKGTSPQTR